MESQAEHAPRLSEPSAQPAERAPVMPGSIGEKLNARPAVVAQRAAADKLSKARANRTELPDTLKAGVESLSGISLDDVRVHRNSPEPAQLQAHAFAQGSDIHLGPGQEQHLPHEAWHVVQQKQGRVTATRQMKGGVDINDDAGLEAEADVMGAQASSLQPSKSTAPLQRRPVSATPPLQAIWRNTHLNDEYFQWDRALQGLRWYANKQTDQMYFIVESLNDENRGLINFEGHIRRFGDWLATGAFRVLDEDNSVDARAAAAPAQGPPADKEYGPHVFRPIKHAIDDETGHMTVKTANYVKANQKQYEVATSAATKAVGKRGEVNPVLKHEGNVGRYVHHLTTLRNLMANPGGGGAGTGIIANGLDPSKGGGKGGACETCVVLNDQRMYDGSADGSKNVVAITTSSVNIKMYTNQRHEHTAQEFAQGRIDAREVILREPILLRFRLTPAHIASMTVDPMHPKDDTVRLLVGQKISAAAIQALTSDGWVPILNVAAMLGEAFGVHGVAGAAAPGGQSAAASADGHAATATTSTATTSTSSSSSSAHNSNNGGHSNHDSKDEAL